MDFTDEQHTVMYPGTEKPGEDGIYKRRKTGLDDAGNTFPIMYCLWSEGWWYEGSVELTSALNEPLRKSHYQPGHWEDFEWCGLMPGSYERPDVQAVRTENFVGGFFEQRAPTLEELNRHAAELDAQIEEQRKLELEEPAAITEEQQFGADFFGEQP